MKKLLVLLLLSTSFSSFANSHLDFTLSDFCYLQPGVQDREGVYYFPNEEVGITAESVCVFKDAYGQYFSKGKLKKGNFDGKWTFWNKNGLKDYEANYKDGKEYGKRTISWHKNDQIKIEGTFKDGKKDGEWTEWHSKVHNKTQQYYNELRKLLRKDKLYKKMRMLKERQHIEIGFKNEDLKKEAQKVIKENFPNLTIVKGSELDFKFKLKIPSGAYKKSEGHFINDKKNGTWISWYETGQIKTEETFKDGKFHGDYIEWDQNEKVKIKRLYENGQIRYEYNSKNGKLDGIHTRWYDNGQKKYEEIYKDGKKNGKFIYWDEDSQIREEKNYKDDNVHGMQTEWYENGQIETEQNFKDGKEDGKYSWWAENGKLKAVVNFKDGKLNGKQIWWHIDGVLKRYITLERNWKDGECISGDCPD